MPLRRSTVSTVVAIAVVVLALVAGAQLRTPPPGGAGHDAGGGGDAGSGGVVSVADVLSGDDDGYARALVPRALEFPRDHGAHDDFRAEWWYFTGNLSDADGRRFGFQLTFFRFALDARARERDSRWGARQAWMAHFALTDVAAGAFHTAERFSRGALGLAGADTSPFRVWLEDWHARSAGEALLPLRLVAAAGDHAIDLALTRDKPRVLHGDAGLSRKSGEPGNASYYYSYTRMRVHGSVRTGDREIEVTGLAWLDREWSTSALAPDQSGWDWFALQLSDGRDLMYYRLRRRDGSTHPFSAGTLVAPDGAATPLGAGDVLVEVTDHWRSPRDGARYPGAWRLRVPAHGVDVAVHPRVADQEMNLSVRYWEGAVRVRGSSGDAPVEGVGYVELTGYAGAQAPGV